MPDLAPDLTPRDETDLFAAEYVIGLLDDAAHAVAARRRETDPDFARDVDGWERRLAALIGEIGPVAVRDDIWPRIAARLPMAHGQGGVWNSLGFWRGATALAAAIAAALAVVVMMPARSGPTSATPPTIEPILASTRMQASDGQVMFVVTLDTASKRVIVTPIGGDGAPGHSHELWLLPEGGAPVSLGVMPSESTAAMPAISGLEVGSALAISVEPEGGSPTGQPTGAVVAQGELTAL